MVDLKVVSLTNSTDRGAPASVSTLTFAGLGLVAELTKVLESEGYTHPTPIQAKAIPSVLEGRDLLGIAQTGTGKTAAFALPILQRLMADRKPAARKGCRALILSPTRELATQISDSFKTYGRNTGMTAGVIFGGVGYKPQINLMARGVDVLVATPGRLIDLMQEGHLSLSPTEILVLDEADQMMDLGFIRPLRQIVAKLSHKRQSLFFSATMPHEIGALAAELLREPVQVSVAPVSKTADRVAQSAILVEAGKKRALLVELLSNKDMARVLVFTRTKRGADKVAKHLEGAKIEAAAIHGNKSQNQREAALEGFKKGRVRVLVATDIAARGIDVDSVTHVVNYELPNIPESYIHRIGRTARAGAEGIAISLVDSEEKAYLRDIEKLIRQTIPHEDRRNDATLIATATVEDRGPRTSHRRPDARSSSARPRGDSNRGGERRDDRSARPNSRPMPGSSAGGYSDRGSRPSGGSDGERRVYDPLDAAARPAAPRPQAARPAQPARPTAAPRQDVRSERGPDRGGERRDDRRDTAAPTRASRSRFDEERASHQARTSAAPGRPAGGIATAKRPAGTSGGRRDY